MNETQEFRLTKNLSLKLENGKTHIYIDGERFRQCMRLLVYVDESNLEEINEIESIDQLKEYHTDTWQNSIDISPQQEFIGHCSNMKVWVENDFDSRLIDSKLAFPILIQLMKSGDEKAKATLKEEICYRIASGHLNIQLYMLYLLEEEDYLFTFEELETLEEDFNLENKKIQNDYKRLIGKKLRKYINIDHRLTTLTHDEILLKFIKEKASPMMMKTLMDFHFIQKLDPFLLNQNSSLIFEKLPPSEYEAFEKHLSKTHRMNRTLELSHNIMERIFGDNTTIFRDLIREALSRHFKQVNGKVLHSVHFIINSEKNCSFCNSRFRKIGWGKKEKILKIKADFRLTFIIHPGWNRKFFSRYICEDCFMRKMDSFIRGFKQLKEEIIKLI